MLLESGGQACGSPAKAREVCFYRRLFVCLSVTTMTKKIEDGICTKFYGKVPSEKGKTKFVFHYDWSKGCGSNGPKNSINWRLFTFYTSNSRCGKWCQVLVTKTPNYRFRGELYSLRLLSV